MCPAHRLSGCLTENIKHIGGVFRLRASNRYGVDEHVISVKNGEDIPGRNRLSPVPLNTLTPEELMHDSTDMSSNKVGTKYLGYFKLYVDD